MTQKNINTMDAIVNKLAENKSISKALEDVYNKRNVVIPYKDYGFDSDITTIGLSTGLTNLLLRNGLRELKDVIEFCLKQKVTSLKTCGKKYGIELFEKVLDYCWNNMTMEEKTLFLIDTVERNENNLKEVC